LARGCSPLRPAAVIGTIRGGGLKHFIIIFFFQKK